MNGLAIVKIVVAVLAIAAGEVLKLGYTDWVQLSGLQYWAGIVVQSAAAFGLYSMQPSKPAE